MNNVGSIWEAKKLRRNRERNTFDVGPREVRSKEMMKAGELGDMKYQKRDVKTIGKLRSRSTVDGESKICMEAQEANAKYSFV